MECTPAGLITQLFNRNTLVIFEPTGQTIVITYNDELISSICIGHELFNFTQSSVEVYYKKAFMSKITITDNCITKSDSTTTICCTVKNVTIKTNGDQILNLDKINASANAFKNILKNDKITIEDLLPNSIRKIYILYKYNVETIQPVRKRHKK
jgi:hypothetical protein